MPETDQEPIDTVQEPIDAPSETETEPDIEEQPKQKRVAFDFNEKRAASLAKARARAAELRRQLKLHTAPKAKKASKLELKLQEASKQQYTEEAKPTNLPIEEPAAEVPIAPAAEAPTAAATVAEQKPKAVAAALIEKRGGLWYI